MTKAWTMLNRPTVSETAIAVNWKHSVQVTVEIDLPHIDLHRYRLITSWPRPSVHRTCRVLTVSVLVIEPPMWKILKICTAAAVARDSATR